MGQGSSKEESDAAAASESSSKGGSRRSRLKQRLHRHSNSSSHNKRLAAEDFAGISLLTLLRAEMKFKDKWLACVSFGEQTFRTQTSDQTDKPVWNSEKKLLLEKNGPHVARISVFETNKMSKNNLIGYCEIDLLEFLTREIESDSSSESETLDLLDPSSPDKVVGKISVSCSIEDPIETEKSFARRILSIVDYNEDGQLSLSEFSDLISAFGNQVAANKVRVLNSIELACPNIIYESYCVIFVCWSVLSFSFWFHVSKISSLLTRKRRCFKAADKNGDGVVSMDELADLLAIQQEKEPIINCCPVCGEILEDSNKLNHMIHLTLCFDEGTGKQVMTGGFLTEKEASYGWMFKLSEWAHFSSYDIGFKLWIKCFPYSGI
ncbi:hypothetical protein M0R45_001750 [Rubus argutus]|uniref:Uncharacterized protein n=1 Tax=Rubus argutus TaxID=59490 RepID=A0AAW1VG61_RUBAR